MVTTATRPEVIDIPGPIEAEPPNIKIRRDTVLTSDAAARLVAEAPPEGRLALLERLVGLGADAESAYRSNMTARLFEERVQGLGDGLKQELETVLKAGGASVEERLLHTLHRFEKDLLAWTTRYIDPQSPEGLPTIASGKLRQATDAAMQQLKLLLADGDEGALAKWSDKVVAQVKDSERAVLAQLVQRQALRRVGVHKGRAYEEELSAKLTQVAVAMGAQVDRCSDTLGTKRRRHGDHLLTFERGQSKVSVVIEAKARDEQDRFSFAGVRTACSDARVNRKAGAAVLVSESRDALPDAVPFGQVGRVDFFVEFDPSDGDDLGLVAALYLARSAAFEALGPATSQPIDIGAAKALIRDVRDRIDRRDRIRGLHSGAVKAINNATKALDEDTEAVVACLVRLDVMLTS